MGQIGSARQKAGIVGAVALAIALVVTGGWIAITSGILSGAPEQDAVIEVVEAISTESIAVTNSYFSVPETVAEVVASALERDQDPANHVDLLRDLTASQDNMAGAFVGYPDGSFLDVRREIDDQLRIKTIKLVDGERLVFNQIFDAGDEIVDEFQLFDDVFDPRERPWYLGASGGDVHWTEPYVFFSSGEPGITHSVPILGADGQVVAVVGVDIRLTNLETFLEARRPSENGTAAVVTITGELIAGSTRLADGAESTEITRAILDSSTSMAASTSMFGEETLVVSVAPLDSSGERLLIVGAPEADFLSDIRTARQTFAMLAGVLAAAGIAMLAFAAVFMRRYVSALHQLASTDPMTGLLNRTVVHEGIDTALGDGSTVTVMTLDLDRFKLVNDKYGHQCGDELLIHTAKRLIQAAPADALVGRLGGDEFCLAFVDLDDPSTLCRSVIEQTAGVVDSDGHSFDLVLSAGFVVAPPGDRDAAQLLQQADVAMYNAKAKSGTAVVEFASSMHLPWRMDNEREFSILAAIETGAMGALLQPERDLSTGEILGAEILLCWDHPTEGPIDTSEFLADIIRFGLLDRFTEIGFAAADRLVDSALVPDDFTIRLNVSEGQVTNAASFERLVKCVGSGLVRWSIEMTEDAVAQVSMTHPLALEQLRRAGVQVVIDNFGTGLMSLSSLRSAPIDAIKIAPEFVHALDAKDFDPPLARATIGLGTILGIEVMASGVDTETQRSALLAAGCTRGYGGLFDEPQQVDDFLQLLQQGQQQPAAA